MNSEFGECLVLRDRSFIRNMDALLAVVELNMGNIRKLKESIRNVAKNGFIYAVKGETPYPSAGLKN